MIPDEATRGAQWLRLEPLLTKSAELIVSSWMKVVCCALGQRRKPACEAGERGQASAVERPQPRRGGAEQWLDEAGHLGHQQASTRRTPRRRDFD